MEEGGQDGAGWWSQSGTVRFIHFDSISCLFHVSFVPLLDFAAQSINAAQI